LLGGRAMPASPDHAARDLAGAVRTCMRHQQRWLTTKPILSMLRNMKMNRLLPALARATGRAEPTVREAVRQLRVRGRIPGAGQPGRGAPEATLEDVARVILALLSGEKPLAAPDDLDRSMGLVEVGDTRGNLLAALNVTLEELVTHGRIDGVEACKLSVSRPWPTAVMKFWYHDGTDKVFLFHHRDARKTGDAEADERKLEVLIQKWGDGRDCVWGAIELPDLRLIANAFAGRLTEEALQRRPAPAVDAVLW